MAEVVATENPGAAAAPAAAVSPAAVATVSPTAAPAKEPAAPGAATAGDPGSLLAGDKPVETKLGADGKPVPDPAADPAKIPISDATKYADFKLPDGVQVDAEGIGAFKGVAAANGLSQAAAQAMLDLHIEQLQAASEEPYTLWHDTQRDWQKATMADKEIGGNNFTAAKKTIVDAINRVGGAEATAAMQALMSTGAGNNPEIIRLLYRLSKPYAEGRFPPGGNPTTGKRTAAQKFYGPANGATPP